MGEEGAANTADREHMSAKARSNAIGLRSITIHLPNKNYKVNRIRVFHSSIMSEGTFIVTGS